MRPALGVSGVIALLLIASGIIRLFGGTGAAIAREVTDLAARPGAPAFLEDGSPACVAAPEIDALLASLSERQADLDQRARALDMRASDIEAARLLVEQQIAELAAAEDSLRDLIAMANSASETDISQLTAVYENMKPKEAAAVFQQMAPEFAAGFLGRMRPESAAAILAGLDPATAYSVSAILAGRNATAPTE